MKVEVEVNSCKECPYFSISNQYSSDGWDKMEDWLCKKEERIIGTGIEWYDEKHVKIPNWCPFSTKKDLED